MLNACVKYIYLLLPPAEARRASLRAAGAHPAAFRGAGQGVRALQAGHSHAQQAALPYAF